MANLEKSRPTDGLLMHPLFADVLSGGFEPRTDPAGRSHTLGRLAVATYQEGIGMFPENLPKKLSQELSRNAAGFTYRPSWAPVGSVVVCDAELLSGYNYMTGLQLRSREGSLTIHTTLLPEGSVGLCIPEQGINGLPLDLAGVQQARELVTQKAQEFFDSTVKTWH